MSIYGSETCDAVRKVRLSALIDEALAGNLNIGVLPGVTAEQAMSLAHKWVRRPGTNILRCSGCAEIRRAS